MIRIYKMTSTPPSSPRAPVAPSAPARPNRRPRYPDGSTIKVGDIVRIREPGNTISTGVVKQINGIDEIVVKIDEEDFFFSPEELRLISINYTTGEQMKEGDIVRINQPGNEQHDKIGVVEQIRTSVVFIHIEEQNKNQRWQADNLQFVSRKIEHKYRSTETIKLGDRVQIDNILGDYDNKTGMVTFIGSKITVRTSRTEWQLWKPEKLIYLYPFNPKTGDIWESTTTDERIIIRKANIVQGNVVGVDYNKVSGDYDIAFSPFTMISEIFIRNFIYQRRGIHVGDVGTNTINGNAIKIVGLDLSVLESVKFIYTSDDGEFPDIFSLSLPSAMRYLKVRDGPRTKKQTEIQPEVGDVWKYDSKRVLLIGVGRIMKYYTLTGGNDVFSTTPDTLPRDEFLKLYTFDEFGPHEGMRWIGPFGKYTVTGVDYKLPITVFILKKTEMNPTAKTFGDFMSYFRKERGGPLDDARLFQWSVWEQKNNGKLYVVTSRGEEGEDLTYVSTTSETSFTMSIKQFLKEFKYSRPGPYVGQKYLRIGQEFTFIEIAELRQQYPMVYKQNDRDAKWSVFWDELFEDYIPQPEAKPTQLWFSPIADTPSHIIREIKTVGISMELKAITTMSENLIRVYLSDFQKEWTYYSELPTTGQVWQYKTTGGVTGIKIIVRHISTERVPYEVYFSEVGQAGRRMELLKNFLKDYRSIDSGLPVVTPKVNEIWKHAKKGIRVKVSLVLFSLEADGPIVHFNGIGQNNTVIWRQEEFLQTYVPVDAVIPKVGDLYQHRKTKTLEKVKETWGNSLRVYTTSNDKYEIQTWLRDFAPHTEETVDSAPGLFDNTLDLKTLMEKTKDMDLKNSDAIQQFSESLLKLEETTEEHVKMLGYLIEMGATVQTKSLEALLRIKLNEHVATMMIMMVKAGANAWEGEKTSLVYALLQYTFPLAANVLIDIINIGINTDDFYQRLMLKSILPGVMTAYFLEDGKLKEPFSDPNQRVKVGTDRVSRLFDWFLKYTKEGGNRNMEPVFDAIIFDPKFKMKKDDIEEWLALAIEARKELGEKRMDHLFALYKKIRIKDKQFYLLNVLLREKDFEVFKYTVETFKIDVNASKKGRTIMHVLVMDDLVEDLQDIFMYMVTHPDYDPNIVDKEGYTAVGRLLDNVDMVKLEVYLDSVMALLSLKKLTPNEVRAGKMTYLQHLCEDPMYVEILKEYLKRNDVDVNAKSASGQTAMHIASYEEAWELLYKTGRVDLNAKDINANSILEYAVQSDYSGKIKWLLSKEEEGLNTKGIIDYVIRTKRDPMPFLEHWGPSYLIKGTPIHFMVHHLLLFDGIKKLIDRDDFQINLVDKTGDNYLAVVVRSIGKDRLYDNSRNELIKLLLEKGSRKIVALRYATNQGRSDIIDMLLTARERKIKDVEKKKRLELDKCSDYKKRVEKMDAEIEELNKLSDKEFEERIGKAQMSKCQNEMDLITLAPWEAMDYKNTLFLRITDLKGKQRTYCLVEKFYKGESYTLNGKKYEEPDEQTTISQYIKKMLYADWVYSHDIGKHKRGRPYSKEDVQNKAGEDGVPGKNRYVVFTPSDGTTYYVKYDKTLKQIIKRERQRVSSDNYANGYYEINGTIFKLPKDWSLPLAIYITAVKKLAIGNEYGSRGASESHGNVMVMTYKVNKIVNFNSYDDIDEERECIGKCPKLKI